MTERTLVVMGVSGVGRTSVAAELVARTGWVLAEGDAFHPGANRRTMAAGRPLDDDRWPWLAPSPAASASRRRPDAAPTGSATVATMETVISVVGLGGVLLLSLVV